MLRMMLWWAWIDSQVPFVVVFRDGRLTYIIPSLADHDRLFSSSVA